MTITLDGTTGITSPNDTTGNQAYTGTLTGGTGIVNLGSGQFYKDASGNVGIGTTTMTGKLNVSGNSHASNWYLGAGGTTDAGTVGMIAANGAYQSFFGSASSPSNAIVFGRASTESARFDGSGNLLIGTSGAQAKLTVAGGSIAPQADPASFWGIDFGASGAGNPPNYISLASGATYDIASGSGMVIIHSNITGVAGYFAAWAGNVQLFTGSGTYFVASLTPSSVQIGLAYNGGTGKYRITNGNTYTESVFVTTIRTRTAS